MKKTSTFGQLLLLFYLPLLAPMSAFFAAGMLGYKLTFTLIGICALASASAWLLSYVRLKGFFAKRVRRMCQLTLLSFGAAASAAYGYVLLGVTPFTETSMLLLLGCVALYSFFVGLSISIPSLEKEEPAPAPQAAPKTRLIMVITPNGGKPQIVVRRMKRGLPPQLPKHGGGGAAVPQADGNTNGKTDNNTNEQTR